MYLQAALDRFAFMTPTTALGVVIALQPLALLKKHIQVALHTIVQLSQLREPLLRNFLHACHCFQHFFAFVPCAR